MADSNLLLGTNASRSRQPRPSVKQSSTAIIVFTDAECAGLAVNSIGGRGGIERIYLHQALVYEVLHNQIDPLLNYKSEGQFGYCLYHCVVPSLQGGPLYKPIFREPNVNPDISFKRVSNLSHGLVKYFGNMVV